MRIKKGDQVKMLSGKDRGKTGTVLRVLLDENRLTVEGLNIYKKKTKPRKQGQKGEVVEVAKPVQISNVAIVCRSCKRATRVGMVVDGTKKVRICKKCGSQL